MKIEVYIWISASEYSPEKWRNGSKNRIAYDACIAHANSVKPTKQIIINHHLKEYKKNFTCNVSTLKSIIDKAKDMDPGKNYITLNWSK